MIRISDTIAIDEREITESFVRASGPGGQNVNSSRPPPASLRRAAFAIAFRRGARPAERLAGARLTRDGVLVITAQRHRTQLRNRADALDRLVELIRRAAVPPVPRRPTRPTAGSRKRRLEAKSITARSNACAASSRRSTEVALTITASRCPVGPLSSPLRSGSRHRAFREWRRHETSRYGMKFRDGGRSLCWRRRPPLRPELQAPRRQTGLLPAEPVARRRVETEQRRDELLRHRHKSGGGCFDRKEDILGIGGSRHNARCAGAQRIGCGVVIERIDQGDPSCPWVLDLPLSERGRWRVRNDGIEPVRCGELRQRRDSVANALHFQLCIRVRRLLEACP